MATILMLRFYLILVKGKLQEILPRMGEAVKRIARK